MRVMKYVTAIVAGLIVLSLATSAQVKNFVPVTTEMLRNPSPEDWLMFSRTYDAQRFSPLKEINKGNVRQLELAWKIDLPTGTTETIPTVYRGVMYTIVPDGTVRALDAATGTLIWQYKRGGNSRSKTLAIYDDMIYYTAPDSFVVALDARTGEMRWETKADSRSHTSGPIVVEGKVLAGGGCGGARANCYIGAYDAKTGKEVWRFYTVAGPDDPEGDKSWGGSPVERRSASTWALPGSYDPVRRLIYWGIANPTPNTRAARHGGNSAAIGLSSPADLYSNSTVALNPDTGKLAWYYQHLPGDDWDEDMNEERMLLRTAVSPDPKFVKWINPDIKKGEQHDIAVNIGEGGGIWALDRVSGKFLWATPFPYNVPNFILSNIDVKTGKTFINEDLIVDDPGERHTICFFNTKSYWPMAYNPSKNFLYVPFIDNCLDMTSANPAAAAAAAAAAPAAPPAAPGAARGAAGGGRGGRGGGEVRRGIARPGVDPNEMNGIARVNMATGEMQYWHLNRVPTTGAVVATAGDLIFWGDIDGKLRAFDADNGKILWEQALGGPISVSTITYAANGRQFVSVITGDNLAIPGLINGNMGPVPVPITPNRMHSAIYTFALPAKK